MRSVMLMKINITDPLPTGCQIIIFYYVKDNYLTHSSDSLPLPVFFCSATGAGEPPDLCECKQKVASDTLDRKEGNNYLLLCKR